MTSDWRLRATVVNDPVAANQQAAARQAQQLGLPDGPNTAPVQINRDTFNIPTVTPQELNNPQPYFQNPSPSVPFNPQQIRESVGLDVSTPTPPPTPDWRSRARLLPPQQVEQPNENQAAIDFQESNPILRTAGRGARNLVGGVTGMIDLPLTALKTGVLGAGLATGNETLQEIGMTPALRESSLGLIDQATGDRLKPVGAIENVADFASELLVPAGGGGLASKADNVASGVDDIAKTLLNPTGTVEQAVKRSLPAPRVTQDASKIGFREVKQASGAAYREAEELGGVVAPEGANMFIKKMLRSAKPENERLGRVFKEGPVGDILESIQKEYAERPMSLADIEALDQRLTEEASRYFSKIDGAKPEFGQIKNIQAALREAVEQSIDDPNLIDGATEGFDAYKRAVQLYARGKRLEEIDDVVQKAIGQQQPARALRRGFDRLRRSKGFNRYTKEEQAIIDTIVDPNFSDNAVEILTSRIPGLIGLGSGQPVLGGALAVGASGARKLAERNQLSRVNRLERQVLEGTEIFQNLGPKDLSILEKRGLNAILGISPRESSSNDVDVGQQLLTE